MGSGKGPMFLNKAKYWADSVFSYTHANWKSASWQLLFSFFLFCAFQRTKKKSHFIRVKKVEAQYYEDETAIPFSSDVTLDLYASAQKEICKLSEFQHLE